MTNATSDLVLSPEDLAVVQAMLQRNLEREFGPPELLRTPFNGGVVRAFGGVVTWRKPTETFHEFCFEVLKLTFGQEWLSEEFDRPSNERHVVAKWLASYSEQSKRNVPVQHSAGAVFQAVAAGGTKHAVLLGRDLLYLQHAGRLPSALLNRLRHHDEFQGAWYEVTVASALMHGGFTLDWLEQRSESHCEFVARHPVTGEALSVEAKSRRHPGILNQSGNRPVELPALAHRNFRAALTKDARGLPFVIFVDVNMPPPASVAEAECQWVDHMRSSIAECSGTPSDPAKFSLAVCTNFTWHHSPDEPIARPAVIYELVPSTSVVRIKNATTLDAIRVGLHRIASLPPHTL